MQGKHEQQNRRRVWRYYDRTESRLGYQILLRGTKHFGWYESGQSKWRFGDAMRQMEDQLGIRLHLPYGSHVLDAGCGVGDVARAMASRFGLCVTGIDLLDFALETARIRSRDKGLEQRTRFQWGDYHFLEFEDASFHGVYTMETLVHSANPRRALSEFLRVMKPDGILVMFEYSRRPLEELSKEALEALENVCKLAAMPAWMEFEHGTLERLLSESGFVDIRSEDVTEQMLPMLSAFTKIAKLPYWIARRIDRVEKAVNSMSAVEMYRYRDAWRYNIYTARKSR